MRLFVAVELDRRVSRALADCASVLRQRADALAPHARIGWVQPENLHVTTRFIGEVSDASGAAIAGALQPELPMKAFDIVVGGVGAFPERGAAPRVLWAGIRAGEKGLAALEAAVNARLGTCGVGPDARPYRPHVTLARVREPAGLRTDALLDGMTEREFGRSRVEAITLFQSRTSPKGAVYTALHRMPLRPKT